MEKITKIESQEEYEAALSAQALTISLLLNLGIIIIAPLSTS